MTVRIVLVGTGNQGEAWCRDFLPPNEADDAVEVVAAVDADQDALERGRELLGLSSDRCYTDAEAAVEARDADALALVVPPHVRESLVDLAVEHDLDVLCEKPLADSLETAARIVRRVEDAGLKMGVTMTQRYRDDVTSLRRQVRSGEYGDVDTIYSRYAVNARSYGTWKPERLYDVANHPMPRRGRHPPPRPARRPGRRPRRPGVLQRLEPAVLSEFAGDPNAHVHLVMANGTSVSYEASNTSAATFNGWGDEARPRRLRRGDAATRRPRVARVPLRRGRRGLPRQRPRRGRRVTRARGGREVGNTWLVERFAEWCEGGEPMETNARDNLQSMATVFAAIESDETGKAVDVQAMLADAEAIAADSSERGGASGGRDRQPVRQSSSPIRSRGSTFSSVGSLRSPSGAAHSAAFASTRWISSSW